MRVSAIADAMKKRAKEDAAAMHAKVEAEPECTQEKKRPRKSRCPPADELPPSASPFPTHRAPSEHEARAVHHALSMLHPEVILENPPADSKDDGGCGSRRLVLDALVGTIL